STGPPACGTGRSPSPRNRSPCRRLFPYLDLVFPQPEAAASGWGLWFMQELPATAVQPFRLLSRPGKRAIIFCTLAEGGRRHLAQVMIVDDEAVIADLVEVY